MPYTCCNTYFGAPFHPPSLVMNASWAAYAPLALRLLVGGSMAAHGIQKLMGGVDGFAGWLGSLGIPAPTLMAWFVTLLETVGGLMIVAGAFTAIVSVLLILNMLVAMFTVHWNNGFFFTNEAGPGIEVNLLYIAAFLALMLGGAGAYSFDESRKKTS